MHPTFHGTPILLGDMVIFDPRHRAHAALTGTVVGITTMRGEPWLTVDVGTGRPRDVDPRMLTDHQRA